MKSPSVVQEQNHLTRELSNEQTIPNVHAGKESENRWITMTNSALCLRPAVVPLMKTMLFCSFFLFSLLALAFFLPAYAPPFSHRILSRSRISRSSLFLSGPLFPAFKGGIQCGIWI